MYINNTMVLLIIGLLGCFYPLASLVRYFSNINCIRKINGYSLKVSDIYYQKLQRILSLIWFIIICLKLGYDHSTTSTECLGIMVFDDL